MRRNNGKWKTVYGEGVEGKEILGRRETSYCTYIKGTLDDLILEVG